MENTPNIRTQTLIWHNMENQIHWTDETDYAWFSKEHIAYTKEFGCTKIGYFVSDKELDNVVFRTTDGYDLVLDDLSEFAEL